MADFDAIIIGTGQAGPSLAHRLAGAGMRVAIIERHRFGGTCVNTGCTPTKTLVASAYAAHLARRAGDYGVRIDGPHQRRHEEGQGAQGPRARLLRARRRAWAQEQSQHHRLPGPRPLHRPARGAGRQRRARRAAHLHQRRRPRPRARHPRPRRTSSYFTNSTLLDIDFVPPHLIIVGGSYIGLEFAQVFRRFGSKVTVIEMAPRLIPREDEDVSAAVADILKGEGIDLRLGVQRPDASRSAATDIAVSLDSRGRRSRGGRHASAARRRPPAQHRRPRPRQGRRRHRPARASSRSTISCAPTCPASGRSATATAGAPSPTPPTTTSRSSPPTCSTTTRAASATASPPTTSTPIRRSAASA